MLTLRTYPDYTLSQVAKPVDDSEDLTMVGDEMLEIMHANGGVGLAANQVGLLLRIIVLRVPGFPEMVMVNPEIKRSKGARVEQEGCLSLPGKKFYVQRATDIWVSYRERDVPAFTANFKARDLLARAIQHEIDHLNGILIGDKAQ